MSYNVDVSKNRAVHGDNNMGSMTMLAITTTIKECYDPDGLGCNAVRTHDRAYEKMALRMADALSKVQSNFDVDQFLVDCGMGHMTDSIGALVLKAIIAHSENNSTCDVLKFQKK